MPAFPPIHPIFLRRLAEWIAAQRARYAAYDEYLSRDLLTFSDDDDPSDWGIVFWDRFFCVSFPPPPDFDPLPPAPTEAYIAYVFSTTSGQQVQRLPTPMKLPWEDSNTRWHYIVDLDRCRLRIHNAAGTDRDFPFDLIPRDREFGAFLGAPPAFGDGGTAEPGLDRPGGHEDVAADVGAHELVLEAPHVEPPVWLRFERVTHVVEPDEADVYLNANLVVRKLLFNRLAARYDPLLREHVDGLTPNYFVYREFAFAILSLAAGDFSLVNAKRVDILDPSILTVYRPIDFRDNPDDVDVHDAANDRAEDNISQIGERSSVTGTVYIPASGYGARKRNVQPGSAPPNASTFWVGSVVVHLAGRSAATRYQPCSIEEAIADAIRFVLDSHGEGLASSTTPTGYGHESSVYGVVFALSGVVLFRASLSAATLTTETVAGGARSVAVEHTAALPLLSLLRHRRVGHQPLNPGAGATFASLTRLFDAAAAESEYERARRGGSALVNAGALPDDVLQLVMHHSDAQTWRQGTSSWSLRALRSYARALRRR
jgi:hypothetical protein